MKLKRIELKIGWNPKSIDDSNEEFTCIWWRKTSAEAKTLIQDMKQYDDGK